MTETLFYVCAYETTSSPNFVVTKFTTLCNLAIILNLNSFIITNLRMWFIKSKTYTATTRPQVYFMYRLRVYMLQRLYFLNVKATVKNFLYFQFIFFILRFITIISQNQSFFYTYQQLYLSVTWIKQLLFTYRVYESAYIPILNEVIVLML